MRLSTTLLLPILLLVGCEDKQKAVVAWPGMSVVEFNRLNNGVMPPLRSYDANLVGSNSPLLINFKRGSQSVSFLDTTGTGGLKLTSSDYDLSKQQWTGAQRINSMSFNIGSNMEHIAKHLPTVEDKCVKLADLAGIPVTPIPDARTLSKRLEITDKTEICSGRGSLYVYQITAYHYRYHHMHGGDYGWAAFLVFLGEAM